MDNKERCNHEFKLDNGKRVCIKCGIKAHEDNDFSYLCGSQYCRCCQ